MRDALTVDVEEYFHPTEVQSEVGARSWTALPSRIEFQVHSVLDLLEESGARATFFILGWVADHHPKIVRAIQKAGHEIACHSYSHQLVYEMTPEEFRTDTERAMIAIEDACGVTPRIYRAPSYSITRKSFWALDVLVELGFTHDSSIFPIKHDRYGIPDFQRHATLVSTASGPILEIPISTVKLPTGRVAPIGGGGYLRMLPYAYTAAGIRRLHQEERQSACIYFHPWELDPDQPKLASGAIAQLRTYSGLRGFRGKLSNLLRDFRFGTVSDVHPMFSFLDCETEESLELNPERASW